jgi:hypothetical protein
LDFKEIGVDRQADSISILVECNFADHCSRELNRCARHSSTLSHVATDERFHRLRKPQYVLIESRHRVGNFAAMTRIKSAVPFFLLSHSAASNASTDQSAASLEFPISLEYLKQNPDSLIKHKIPGSWPIREFSERDVSESYRRIYFGALSKNESVIHRKVATVPSLSLRNS